MKCYTFNIVNHIANTAHLEPLEDLAYRRMIDLYYRREAPLPSRAHDVARLIRMRQHMPEVESVLHEFFRFTTNGWEHPGANNEITRRVALAQAGGER